jgi:hypothetical protein
MEYEAMESYRSLTYSHHTGQQNTKGGGASMATYQVTVATMVGQVRLNFSHVYNRSKEVLLVFPENDADGNIKVTRSEDGSGFEIGTSLAHIRVIINLDGPDDLDEIGATLTGNTSGWWMVDGYTTANFDHPSNQSQAINKT